MSLSFPKSISRLKICRAFSSSSTRSTSREDTKKEKPLYGSAPSHQSYIFLHASEPPTAFSARHSSPIQRALQMKVMQWGGNVNFSWFGPPKTTGQALTAFSTLGGRLEIPNLTLENLDEVEEKLKKHAVEGPLVSGTSDEIHLYVCTHGARDCRCGETGGEVYRALQEEVKRLVEEDPFGIASRIKVGEVGHVGGHIYAANLLIYPHGEWLGMLKPDDVPAIMAKIIASSVQPFTRERHPISPSHWRGRMGLSKDEQTDLFQSLYPNTVHSH